MAGQSEDGRASFSTSPTDSMRTTRRIRDILMPRRSSSSTSPRTLKKTGATAVDLGDASPSDRKTSHTTTKNANNASNGEARSSTVPAGSLRSEADSVAVDARNVQKVNEAQFPSPYKASGSTNADTMATVVTTHDAQESHHPSSTGGESPLSTDNHKEVPIKVAETAHECSGKCPVRSPMTITLKLKIQPKKDVPNHATKRLPINANIFEGPKRIGPFVFAESSNTRNLQLGMIGIYTLTILFAAFIGPKTLSITLWKLAVALLAYYITGRLLGWEVDAQSDFVLAPVLHMAGVAQKVLYDAVDGFGVLEISLEAQVVSETLGDVDSAAVSDLKG
ncbi:hypothetical protein OPT61_g823 [Boeremia exigua]|uniref:Uncharacterized protein n=1 Tax=Boeremia exigua TaxID=749465 RepID=A0ACC2ISK4_9PLEO|nr:hypothetical protein OPT61_g823 [Boeremia exigua]